jgi:hypothetical protein
VNRSSRVIPRRAVRCRSVGQNDGRIAAAELRGHRELGKLPRTARYGLILQLGGSRHRPWLSVNDRWWPMVRAHRGHGRRDDVARAWW